MGLSTGAMRRCPLLFIVIPFIRVIPLFQERHDKEAELNSVLEEKDEAINKHKHTQKKYKQKKAEVLKLVQDMDRMNIEDTKKETEIQRLTEKIQQEREKGGGSQAVVKAMKDQLIKEVHTKQENAKELKKKQELISQARQLEESLKGQIDIGEGKLREAKDEARAVRRAVEAKAQKDAKQLALASLYGSLEKRGETGQWECPYNTGQTSAVHAACHACSVS